MPLASVRDELDVGKIWLHCLLHRLAIHECEIRPREQGLVVLGQLVAIGVRLVRPGPVVVDDVGDDDGRPEVLDQARGMVGLVIHRTIHGPGTAALARVTRNPKKDQRLKWWAQQDSNLRPAD